MRERIQSLGGFLAGMIIPNIGAFIAWGLITALFIPTGWLPNESLAELVGPMIIYLLPILIGYTGGYMIYGSRGGVLGAAASMGVIVGADIPMFLGAMIMGPIGGWTIQKIDELLEDKIPIGFEMLINNFSAGIWAIVLILLAYVIIGPIVQTINNFFGAVVDVLISNNLIALSAIVIEPAKVLFLNNAINHGILAPLGVQQVTEQGYSLLFLLETNPGPGLGLLIAYYVMGKGLLKQSAPGAMIIHFLGGIHEIYFPYVLAHPIMILSVIAGGLSANFWFSVTGAGLVATPSPGSIFAYLAVIPLGKHFVVLTGVAIGTAVSFMVGAFLLRVRPVPIEEEEAEDEMQGAGLAVPGIGD